MSSPRRFSGGVWVGISVLVVILALFVGCLNQEESPLRTPMPTSLSTPTPTPPPEPRVSFDVEFADLGKVPLGEEVTYTFRFRNIGRAPLVVEDARAKAVDGC